MRLKLEDVIQSTVRSVAYSKKKPCLYPGWVNARLKGSKKNVSGPDSPTTFMAARCFIIRACHRQQDRTIRIISETPTDHFWMNRPARMWPVSFFCELSDRDLSHTSLSLLHAIEKLEINRNPAISVPGGLEGASTLWQEL